MFFIQAEGGIRDLVRFRGIGDVYKGLCTRFVTASSDAVSKGASKAWASLLTDNLRRVTRHSSVNVRPTTVAVANAADVDTSPAEAGSSTDPKVGDVIEEEDEVAKGSAEEAKTKKHQLTHFPGIPSLKFARKPGRSANRRRIML